MGERFGAVLAGGVLLLLMAPLAGASEPQLDNQPPGWSKVKEIYKLGEDNANAAQQQANQGASQAQQQAVSVKYEALDAANHAGDDADDAAGTGEGVLMGIMTSAGAVAGQVLSTIFDLLGNVLPDPRTIGTPPTGSSGQGDFEAAGFAAGADSLTGLAMVVAAGAVGVSLLWWVVLQRAFFFGVVPLLSRIAHSEIYTNDARRLISQLATGNPGLCLNDIVAKTGYSRNAVSYHLFVLEKEQEIISIKDGKYRRYFPRSGKYVNGAKNVVSALRNDTTLRMAQHIQANPGTIQRELCQLLGTTASAACWHAKRLEQLGVIRKERVANTVQYFPGEAVAKYDLSEFGLASASPVPAAPAAVATAPPPALT